MQLLFCFDTQFVIKYILKNKYLYKMVPQIERIVENCKLGEGPHWDQDTKSLYFIDYFNHKICKYVPSSTNKIFADVGARVSIIIPVKGRKNTFLISIERKLKVISWDGESNTVSILKELDIESDPGTTFNDGKCDPSGRLWVGSMGELKEGHVENDRGSLYKVEGSHFSKVLDKVTISNGLAFNVELKKLYYVDSITGTVDEFDFDIETGTIKNRQPVFTLSKHDIPGILDGMAIDSDGNLWVAVLNGGRVIQINPREPETLLYTLTLPAKQTTSVAFGGENLDELYVTSGRIEYGTTEKLSPPENGAIYRVTGLEVKGLPGESFIL